MGSKDFLDRLTATERDEGWLSARRVQELLPDVTNVDSVRRIAKRLRWPSRRRGIAREYPVERVRAEVERREAEEAASLAVAGV